MILDLVAFEEEVYKASYKALDAIKEDCQSERLYSFVLETTSLFGYVFPYANTEEGIIEGAKYDVVNAKGFHGHLDIALKCNRWEPSTRWRFFKKHHDCFDEVNKILEDVNIQDALCKLPDEEFSSTTAQIEDVLFNVVNRLRENGHFGRDNENFYANIFYYDQTFEGLHRCALRANSGELCKRMFNDLSDVLNFFYSNDQTAG